MTYEIKYRKEEEMKDSGIEWLGKVPKDWEICKIKDISLLKTGDSISAIDKDSKYSNLLLQYYPYIGTKDIDISTNMIEYDNELYIPKKTQFKVAKENTVLMCIEGGSAGRKIGYLNRKSCYGNKLCNIEGNNKIINRLLYYILQSDHFVVEFFNKMTGIIPGVSIEDFKNINSILPNPKDQEKISNFLDLKTSEFNSIISKKEKLIVKLEEAKKSLISEVVTGKVKIVDGEIVERKAEEMKESEIKSLGKIPNDYEIANLIYLSKNITDGAHISPDTNNGREHFVSVRDIVDNKIDFENSLLTTRQNYEYLVRMGCKPVKGDVLISKDGTLGKTVVVDYHKDFVVSSSLIIIKPIISINPYYLEYVLNASYYQEQVRMFARGAALPRISITNIKNSKVIYTKQLSEQKNIIQFLDCNIRNLNSIITKTKLQIQKLKLAKQSLISEAVTGKIDLSDWEII